MLLACAITVFLAVAAGTAVGATTALPATQLPASIGASYSGSGYTIGAAATTSAWRWSSAGWTAASIPTGGSVYVYPYGSGWSWAWRQNAWYAIRTASIARFACDSANARTVTAGQFLGNGFGGPEYANFGWLETSDLAPYGGPGYAFRAYPTNRSAAIVVNVDHVLRVTALCGSTQHQSATGEMVTPYVPADCNWGDFVRAPEPVMYRLIRVTLDDGRTYTGYTTSPNIDGSYVSDGCHVL